jgi:homoserine dehydrogenase
MIPRSHPLAGVGDAFNAVFVEAQAAGQLMFYGRGAGGTPTASAVLGDIVAAARNRLSGTRAPSESNYAHLAIRPIGAAVTRYHINLDVDDRPGVLAAVAGVFAKHEVSIATVRQSGREEDAKARDRDPRRPGREPGGYRRRTVASWSIVRSIASVLRVEGGV